MTTDTFARGDITGPLQRRSSGVTKWGQALSVCLAAALSSAVLVAVTVGMLHVGVLLVVLLLGAAVLVPAQPWVIALYVAGAAISLAVLTAVWLAGWGSCTEAPFGGTLGSGCHTAPPRG